MQFVFSSALDLVTAKTKKGSCRYLINTGVYLNYPCLGNAGVCAIEVATIKFRPKSSTVQGIGV
jgi:hypothetical protein